ncbi:hypothetical protein PENTCL1PPCAC_24625, partial [Pristionchus entomophagus]
EIRNVVGTDRLPSLSDQPQMLYTRAFIHEIQRFANILAKNVPRTTTRDTEVGGHGRNYGLRGHPLRDGA